MALTDHAVRGDMSGSALLRTAADYQDAGRLEEAEALVREALELDPAQPEALHLAGVIALRTGRPLEALDLIDRALARAPRMAAAHASRGDALSAVGRPGEALGAYHDAIALDAASPAAWCGLGDSLRELQRPDEALRAYREALARDPGLASAHLNQGLLFMDRDQHEAAAASFERAVAARPDWPRAHAQLATARRRAGRLDEAIEGYRRAVTLDPALVTGFCDMGHALWEAGRQQEAAEALHAALALDPERPETHCHMGHVCRALGYLDQALSAYRRALAARPDFADAHYHLGVLLDELHRPLEAIASYRTALTFQSDDARAHARLGLALLGQRRSAEAVTAFRHALHFEPGAADTWRRLGDALMEEQRPREALAAYDRAMTIVPGLAEAHWGRARALLGTGEYAEGWAEFEWRFRVPELRVESPHADLPQWEGDRLEGRSILVRAGQDEAATLQFARFLPMLASLGGRVVLECAPALAPLLEAMPALARVVMRGESLPPADCQVALQSPPALLGRRADPIIAESPYLPERTWSVRIPVLPPGEGRRIGIAWRAADPHSALALSQLAPLFRLPGITWYSLQADGAKSELRETVEARAVQDLGPLLRNYAHGASVMGQLDLVIGVDGPVAHLAGGLGMPLWVLLSAAPAWYWCTAGGPSPWYPNARQFRQPRAGEWSAVVEDLRRALAGAIPVAETVA